MSGGIAYMYDPEGTFSGKCNKSMVTLEPVLLQQAEQERTDDKALWHAGETDEVLLKGLIERHFQFTGFAACEGAARELGRVAPSVRQGLPDRIQARSGRTGCEEGQQGSARGLIRIPL